MDPDDCLDEETPAYDRKMKSLHLLTTKFVQLLEEAENGELDLRHVRKLQGCHMILIQKKGNFLQYIVVAKLNKNEQHDIFRKTTLHLH